MSRHPPTAHRRTTPYNRRIGLNGGTCVFLLFCPFGEKWTNKFPCLALTNTRNETRSLVCVINLFVHSSHWMLSLSVNKLGWRSHSFIVPLEVKIISSSCYCPSKSHSKAIRVSQGRTRQMRLPRCLFKQLPVLWSTPKVLPFINKPASNTRL